MQDTILVLGQRLPFMELVARTLRYQQVYCQLLPMDTTAEKVCSLNPKGIILAAEQDGQEECPPPDPALLTSGVPVLALGRLASTLCAHFGGTTAQCLPASGAVTFGASQSPLFTDIAGGERMLHSLECFELPESLVSIATATEWCIGFQHQELPVYAIQYPIEHNDPDAARLLCNFACLVCGAKADWDEDSIIAGAVEMIREAAGEGRVLCAVSGGVDSAVCARLAHMAVGDRLDCLFIDTGFFRKDEPQETLRAYTDLMGIPVTLIDAGDSFMNAMKGVCGRREKERLAGELLSRIFLERLGSAADVREVVLGTNLDDILHGEPSRATRSPFGEGQRDCRVTEPMIDLFKEEVRHLAAALSLPPSLVTRQSFPSGGLALRMTGLVSREKLDVLRLADAFLQEEITEGGHEKRLWQYYAELQETPGSGGSYTIALRALQTAQAGTYAARLPFDLLERVTQRILSESASVNRVMYDLTPGMRDAEQE